jgi:FixJ family two-component response regulator
VALIAVVDDEEPVRKALKRLLRAAGLQVEIYASGREFLERAAQRRPDCLVLDLHMPGTSGLQLLRQINAGGEPMAIVIITAHDTPETREQCLAAGARAYLRKPLDDRLLFNAISAAIGAAAQGRRS